jgi:hypothetical protein
MLHNRELKSKGGKTNFAYADLGQTKKEGDAYSPSHLGFKVWVI